VLHRPVALDVLLPHTPTELSPDAAANLAMLRASGFSRIHSQMPPDAPSATLLIDALLGTGLAGPPRGEALALIEAINASFPNARVCAVDLPSGMNSDVSSSPGPVARADWTVTFTAPKIAHALPPNCNLTEEITIGPIGSPESLYAHIPRDLVQPSHFRHLLAPRSQSGHKGNYGHVLIVAGSRDKPGAAALAGLAALRAGAGLVTVASAASAIGSLSAHTPELMTAPLAETETGEIAFQDITSLTNSKTVLALGPGLGTHPETVRLVRALYANCPLPAVCDADALNALAPDGIPHTHYARVLTPHPGEMARLLGRPVGDRLADAHAFSARHNATLLLKGQRTVIATPAGHLYINPTGSPAMATAGSGDILTGLLAGLLAQSPFEILTVTLAAAWLHGAAGELAAAAFGEKPVIATDLLAHFPAALRRASA
jgi:ADP-dependent NAD(P)H-hydrate dehydratase / NAD(P)H-hydrate epimerase